MSKWLFSPGKPPEPPRGKPETPPGLVACDMSWMLELRGDRLYGLVSTTGDQTGQVEVESERTVLADAWTLVEMRFVGGTLTLWINGAPDASAEVPGTIHVGEAPVWIGARPGKGGAKESYFRGVIDEVTVGAGNGNGVAFNGNGHGGGATLEFTYDEAGNMLSDGLLQYRYDFLNRLARVSDNGYTIARCEYDGGKRGTLPFFRKG